MSTPLILLILAIIAIVCYAIGTRHALAIAGGLSSKLHSRPGYYGTFVAICAVLPAAIILVAWLIASPLYINSAVRAGFPEDVQARSQAEQGLAFGMVNSLARGMDVLTLDEIDRVGSSPSELRSALGAKGVPLAGDPEPYMVESAGDLNAMTKISSRVMTAIVLIAALAGAGFS
jgi:phosphate transport system permease protein